MAIWDIKERNDLVRANEIRGDRALFAGGQTPSASNVVVAKALFFFSVIACSLLIVLISSLVWFGFLRTR